MMFSSRQILVTGNSFLWEESHETGNPHQNRSGSLPKKYELTPIEKTLNPGFLRALISVTRQNGLRSEENEALFDRKLLEYLYEQGVRMMPAMLSSGRLFWSRG